MQVTGIKFCRILFQRSPITILPIILPRGSNLEALMCPGLKGNFINVEMALLVRMPLHTCLVVPVRLTGTTRMELGLEGVGH